MAVTIEWIDDPARFAAVAGAWDEAAALGPAPFSESWWLMAWWRSFGEHRLAICVVWEAGELVAGFPLCAHGRSLRGLANTETPALRPVTRDAQALAHLSEAVLASTRRLVLPNLPAGEPVHRALTAAAANVGRFDVALPQYDSPLTDTTGDFEQYRSAMRHGWRELERRGRKMAREHDVELVAVEPPKDFAAELEAGLRLEASGWKGLERTAILSSPAMAGFYRDVAHSAHERGELRFSTLRLDGRLVAFDLAILSRQRYFLLKTAYDESTRRLAPGLWLRRAVVERCFALGLETHEFLGEDMSWKRVFATGARRHVTYRAFDRGPVGVTRYVYRSTLRPALKSLVWAIRGNAHA